MNPFIISPQSLKKLEIEATRTINYFNPIYDSSKENRDSKTILSLIDEIKRLNELVETYRKELE